MAIATAVGDTSAVPPSRVTLFHSDKDFGWNHEEAFGDEFSAQLSEALGVDDAQVDEALRSVGKEFGPASSRGRWSMHEVSDLHDRWSAAFAEALGSEQREVDAALQEIRVEWEGGMADRFGSMQEQYRVSLVEDLDEAIADGTLSAADKESVLKAFDAGVVGGGFDGRHDLGGWHGYFGDRNGGLGASS